MFPRTLFRARWVWTILLLPGFFLVGYILTLLGSVFLNASLLSSPGPSLAADHWPDLVPQIGASTLLLYTVGGLGALVVNYRRSDVNQKRRIRVLVAGTLVGFVGAVPPLLFSLLRSSSPAARFFTSDGYLAFITLLFAALPLSWAYAILRHQLFDIRVHRGLRFNDHRRSGFRPDHDVGRCAPMDSPRRRRRGIQSVSDPVVARWTGAVLND
jgi:hypothetical protein